MKVLMSIVCATALFPLLADDQKSKPLEEIEQTKAARRELMLQKTGGIIDRTGQGKILIVNCQNLIGDDVIADRVDRFHRMLKFTFEIRRGEWLFGVGKPDDADLVIYLIDDENLPMSLVAVEARWAVLNTSGLKLGMRFSREFTRVLTLVAAAGKSQSKTSPMQAVKTPLDLDKLPSDNITFDMMQGIVRNMADIGVTQSIKTSYLKACNEGWAPAPTNDYQQAIWDKVHAVPATPMKIEFDPKKGR